MTLALVLIAWVLLSFPVALFIGRVIDLGQEAE